jgi:hypothetical protein
MSAGRNGCTSTATVTLVGVALTVALAVIAVVALVRIAQNL